MAVESNDPTLLSLISHHTGASEITITSDASFSNLGLDSIAAVRLADELLSRFELTVHPDEVFGLSLGRLRGYVGVDTVGVDGDHGRNSVGLGLSRSQGIAVQQMGSKEEDGDAVTAAAKQISTPAQQPPQQLSPRNPFPALSQSNTHFESLAKHSGFSNYWENVAPLQNDLLLSYITEAFIHLGINLSDYPHGIEIPLLQPPTIIPKYTRLLQRLLSILEARYIVIQRAGKVLRGSDRIDDLASSTALCDALRTQHPAFSCEADLLGLIGPKLADCLSGKVDPVSVLFGSQAPLSIMETFYAQAPMMSALTAQLVTFLTIFLHSADYGRDHPVRILEVGGGTGGTTLRLAKALTKEGIAVEYTFTDVGLAFVTKAKARFENRYSWMRFEVLNLEHEIPAAFLERFDVVLGANVVHATIDHIATCRRLRETLRPSLGVLVLSEVTRVIDWYDICFGLLDGWWVSQAGKGYPIQPAEEWMDVFERAGFASVGFSTGATEEANSQQLLVACNHE